MKRDQDWFALVYGLPAMTGVPRGGSAWAYVRGTRSRYRHAGPGRSTACTLYVVELLEFGNPAS